MSSDPLDLAAEYTEAFLEAARAKRKEERHRPYTGYCYNCEEPLPAPQRFCDEDCRDDFDHRQERVRVNVRVAG